MTRLFAITTAILTGIIGVLVGLLLSMPRTVAPKSPAPQATASATNDGVPAATEVLDTRPASANAVNFADIAARLNPAVVNIDATARGLRARRGRLCRWHR